MANHTHSCDIEWHMDPKRVEYLVAQTKMEDRAAAIRANNAPERIWLVEHPPLYTAGTSADQKDLLDDQRFPIFQTGRGGQYTYHGPGQRVVYVMLDLKHRGSDVRAFVHDLENWMILTLATFGITGERRTGRVGIWVVNQDGTESKIGAIGVRVRKWVSYHGLALNVSPDLSHFTGIVPCGISDHGVTSLLDLGIKVSLTEVDQRLRETFETVFQRKTIVV